MEGLKNFVNQARKAIIFALEIKLFAQYGSNWCMLRLDARLLYAVPNVCYSCKESITSPQMLVAFLYMRHLTGLLLMSKFKSILISACPAMATRVAPTTAMPTSETISTRTPTLKRATSTLPAFEPIPTVSKPLSQSAVPRRLANWDLLRSIAMFLVVVVHTSGNLGLVGNFDAGYAVGTAAILCDPLFFALSGYFALGPIKRGSKATTSIRL